jgi:hypothetical protein
VRERNVLGCEGGCNPAQSPLPNTLPGARGLETGRGGSHGLPRLFSFTKKHLRWPTSVAKGTRDDVKWLSRRVRGAGVHVCLPRTGGGAPGGGGAPARRAQLVRPTEKRQGSLGPGSAKTPSASPRWQRPLRHLLLSVPPPSSALSLVRERTTFILTLNGLQSCSHRRGPQPCAQPAVWSAPRVMHLQLHLVGPRLLGASAKEPSSSPGQDPHLEEPPNCGWALFDLFPKGQSRHGVTSAMH